jgi:hypothetical protein
VKYAALILSIIFLQACSHPLEIVGEGDITEVTGSGRGCTLEQYQAGEKTCRKNTVIGAYNVSYYPVARKGWEFAYWEGYCFPDSPEPYCNFKVGAKLVKDNWFKPAAPLRAVFTDAGPWFPDSDSDGYGDEFDEGFLGAQPDPSYVKDFSDCNDNAAAVYPGATELADLLDNNCDEVIDENTKYVFASANAYDGNMGGLSGADAICQAEANSALDPLPGQYFAYLSSSTVNARDRNTYVGEENYQWRRVDGTLLANCWSCFYDDGFLNQGTLPNHDADGALLDTTSFFELNVWTGTQNGGTKFDFASTCNDWTSNSSSIFGRLGYADGGLWEDTVGKWQESRSAYECWAPFRLYCVQR